MIKCFTSGFAWCHWSIENIQVFHC